MLKWFVLAGISAAIVSIDEPALAWLDVCNRTNERVRVAFTYNHTADNRDNSPILRKGWVSQGWWILSRNQCARVYPHELWRRNRYYYFYAESLTGNSRWRGNYWFCGALQRSQFELTFADHTCGLYTKDGHLIYPVLPKNLSSYLDLSWIGFREIDIGSGRVANYTLNLTR